jgi:hypothetical protein
MIFSKNDTECDTGSIDADIKVKADSFWNLCLNFGN